MEELKKKLHNWILICISWVAVVMCVLGAMGLDGDSAWLCFFGFLLGALWLLGFFYANKERFEVW